MGKIIRSSLFMAILLVSYDGLAYSYKLDILGAKINKSTKKRQLIVGFYDYHLKTHPINKNHRMYIESLLKRFLVGKGKLIVEDLGSVNNDGKMICCNFGINSAEGVLGQLANKARSLGVKVDNIEYRYCRVAGIGPLLNNLQAHPHSFRSSATINTASLHKEVVDEIEKIKKYNDGKLLNDYYKRTVNVIGAALLKINFKDKGTIADYCKTLQSKHYRQELEKLCIFDSALIDMNIMHAITSSPDEPLIFVIAGGSHIEHVSSLLKRIGYESLLQTSTPAVSGLKKVLNSDSSITSCDVHPQPIDLTIIEKFIQ